MHSSATANQISLFYVKKWIQGQIFKLSNIFWNHSCMKLQMFSDFAIIGKKNKHEHLKDIGLWMRDYSYQHKTKTLSWCHVQICSLGTVFKSWLIIDVLMYQSSKRNKLSVCTFCPLIHLWNMLNADTVLGLDLSILCIYEHWSNF